MKQKLTPSEQRPRLTQETPPRPFDIDRIPETSHPSKTVKTVNRLITLALVVALVALGVMLKWGLESSEVLQVNNSPFPARVVKDPTGVTGGTVYLKINYCKMTDKPGNVRISYLSASREQFTPVIVEKAKEGCAVMEYPVVIPTNLSEDQYRIKFRVTYDLNPLKQNIPVEFESQPVNVGSTQ